MATSNIVSTLGAGSGIDIKALAENLVEAERAPRKERIDGKIKQSEARISGYGALKYSLSQLKSAFEKINDASEFASVKASNSQPSAFGVTTSSTSGTGSYSVEITRIATEQRTASQTFTTRDVQLNNGLPFTLSLKIGNGAETSIKVEPKNADGTARPATPADVVSAINSANNSSKTGVTAQLLNTGSGYQIVLSGQTGIANAFSLTASQTSNAQVETQTADTFVVNADAGTTAVTASYTDSEGSTVSLELVKNQDGKWEPAAGAGLPPEDANISIAAQRNPAVLFNQSLQPALDASFKVNGLPISRATNSVNDVIEGVTLNLYSVTTSANPARLDLSRETGSIKDNLKALVTAYNEFNDSLKVLGDRKSTVETFGGSLAGDSMLQSVSSQIRRLISDPSSTPGSTIQAARNVGLSIDRNGVLQLDESRLDKALQDNFGEVVTMFTADKNNVSVYSTQKAGLAGDAVRKLDELMRSTGAINKQTESTQKQITSYQAELERLKEQMDKLMTRYMGQFSVMESIVGQSNSLRSSLKGTFEGMMKSYTG